jgi:RNA polymerase sigma-70 factor (ECF subfamily)
MEDSQIVALYLQRDERALEETARKYGNYCFSITHNILGNREDAEEAVSDTYLGAWATIPPHKPVILSTFLGKIARRTAIKRYQHNRTLKRGGGELALALEELSEFLSDGNTPESAIENAELARILNEFLRKLPKEERTVFVCRYWYLDPIADIAKRFGFSQSKVKSMLARTRKKLSAALQKEGIAI